MTLLYQPASLWQRCTKSSLWTGALFHSKKVSATGYAESKGLNLGAFVVPSEGARPPKQMACAIPSLLRPKLPEARVMALFAATG